MPAIADTCAGLSYCDIATIILCGYGRIWEYFLPICVTDTARWSVLYTKNSEWMNVVRQRLNWKFINFCECTIFQRNRSMTQNWNLIFGIRPTFTPIEMMRRSNRISYNLSICRTFTFLFTCENSFMIKCEISTFL